MLVNRNTEFSGTLRRLRSKSGKSKYRLAQYTGLDEAYIGRLESGERQKPLEGHRDETRSRFSDRFDHGIHP